MVSHFCRDLVGNGRAFPKIFNHPTIFNDDCFDGAYVHRRVRLGAVVAKIT